MTVAQESLGGSPAIGSSLQQNSHFLPTPIITDSQVWVAGITASLHRIDRPAKFFLAGRRPTTQLTDVRARSLFLEKTYSPVNRRCGRASGAVRSHV
jgi:hypothetical protein